MAKTLDLKIRKAFEKADPCAAKRLGRQVVLREDWEEVKYLVMVTVLISKFENTSLLKLLLETGTDEIVEDTIGRCDNEWEIYSCSKCMHVEKKNLLGKALVEVREFYIKLNE